MTEIGIIRVVLLPLCLVAIAIAILQVASANPATTQPPSHTNHTAVDEYFWMAYHLVRTISVGDITGSRQIIIWLEFQNNANDNWSVYLGNMKVQAPGGEWRQCYRSCWSKLAETWMCQPVEHQVWSHLTHTVAPRTNATGWAIFELSKYEFDSMKQLRFQWSTPEGELTATLPISPGRQPEPLPYVRMLSPVPGQRLAWLGSVKFQVVDRESRPINWTVDLDGELHLEGKANPPLVEPCPTTVETSFGGWQLSPGVHHLVVKATDGRVSEAVQVDFVIQRPAASELQPEWTINTSDILAGKTFGAGHQGCQTVWDVDGDGVNEIVFGTRRGDSRRLWCFDANQNLEWIYPSIDKDGLPGDPTSKVSLVDVNKDGTYELCLAGRGGRLHVLDGHGQVIWTWDDPMLGTAMHGAPQACDVNGDGFVEFFQNDDSGFIHCVDHTGQLVWTSFQTSRANQGAPAVGDVDKDGEYEVLWGCQDGNVYCVSAATGDRKWQYDTGANIKAGSPIVADINGDAEYEVLIWHDFPGRIVCISYVGAEVWTWTLPALGNIRICQAMGDVDGDGSMDMAVSSDVGQYVVDIGGAQPKVKWWMNVTDLGAKGTLPAGTLCSAWSSYQLIADIDGDDRLEILWLLPYPIATDAATGVVEAYYVDDNVATYSRQENGGWWGDLDKDGISEWIVELNGKSHPQTRVYCLTLNGNFPASSPWPEYYHSAYPAEYQNKQDWLTLKAAYSNSLWFPMSESFIFRIAAVVCPILALSARIRPKRSDR